MAVDKASILSKLPEFIKWKTHATRFEETIIVLDDDPTGTQTVNDVPVLTNWDVAVLESEFRNDTSLFFILTNSRGLNEKDTIALHQELARNLKTASANTHKLFFVVSRSDSTLRGHFPLEPQVLGKELFNEDFLTILIPSFFEGGRYTIGNVHYVEEENELIPAAETPFAKDNAFGYTQSNLYDWACEKDPTLARAEIFDLSIDELRRLNADDIAQKIVSNIKKKVLIVNACDYEDLKRFTIAFRIALKKAPFPFIYRTAASIVPVLGNVDRKAVLPGDQISEPGKAGLIMVGSYVPKTTSQLQELLDHSNIASIEITVGRLLDHKTADKELDQISRQISNYLSEGKNVVAYTSRTLKSGKGKNENISIINTISAGVVKIVKDLTERPGYLIAKGGITSSDIATKSLGIKRATIMGQALPGVPVWKSGEESKFPGLPYIIFPGNVGGKKALLGLYHKLTQTP